MGLFDTVNVPCPTCGHRHPAQSKSGECTLAVYDLEDAPVDILMNVNRHAPFTCAHCGTVFRVALTMQMSRRTEVARRE